MGTHVTNNMNEYPVNYYRGLDRSMRVETMPSHISYQGTNANNVNFGSNSVKLESYNSNDIDTNTSQSGYQYSEMKAPEPSFQYNEAKTPESGFQFNERNAPDNELYNSNSAAVQRSVHDTNVSNIFAQPVDVFSKVQNWNNGLSYSTSFAVDLKKHDSSNVASTYGASNAPPSTNVFQKRPASNVFRELPAPTVYRERPAVPKGIVSHSMRREYQYQNQPSNPLCGDPISSSLTGPREACGSVGGPSASGAGHADPGQATGRWEISSTTGSRLCFKRKRAASPDPSLFARNSLPSSHSVTVEQNEHNSNVSNVYPTQAAYQVNQTQPANTEWPNSHSVSLEQSDTNMYPANAMHQFQQNQPCHNGLATSSSHSVLMQQNKRDHNGNVASVCAANPVAMLKKVKPAHSELSDSYPLRGNQQKMNIVCKTQQEDISIQLPDSKRHLSNSHSVTALLRKPSDLERVEPMCTFNKEVPYNHHLTHPDSIVHKRLKMNSNMPIDYTAAPISSINNTQPSNNGPFNSCSVMVAQSKHDSSVSSIYVANNPAFQRTKSDHSHNGLVIQLHNLKKNNGQLTSDKHVLKKELSDWKKKCEDLEAKLMVKDNQDALSNIHWRQKYQELEAKLKEKSTKKPNSTDSCSGFPVDENCCDTAKEIKCNLMDLMERQFNCCICDEVFIEATVTNCNHVFCSYCLNQWKSRSKECPFCRTVITRECRAPVVDEFIINLTKIVSDRSYAERIQLLENREFAARNAAPNLEPIYFQSVN